MSEESVIQLKQAVIKQRDNIILKDVNIDIKRGEFIYLIGRVGSGKSSLLKTLYGELPLQLGIGNIAGFQLNKIKAKQKALLRRKLGIVFQDFRLLTDRNVHDNLLFVLKATGWKNKKAIKERITNVLEKTGMSKKGYKMPHELSGGEQQRIVIARALLNSPEVILADEPTGNIDPETSYQLTELLRELSDSGKTVIIATHQYDLIERYPGIVYKCEDSYIKKYDGNVKSVTKSVNDSQEVINIEFID
jgi:cell division transport system ATP-binding protein